MYNKLNVYFFTIPELDSHRTVITNAVYILQKFSCGHFLRSTGKFYKKSRYASLILNIFLYVFLFPLGFGSLTRRHELVQRYTGRGGVGGREAGAECPRRQRARHARPLHARRHQARAFFRAEKAAVALQRYM